MRKARRSAARKPRYAWQRLPEDAPDWERDYVASLTQGLEQSQTIGELIQGLAIWLLRVGEMEKARNKPRIVVPGQADSERFKMN